ncbi:MAG: CapA family protein [Clostridia bacterium]|nr:CapA family protein [Clostridia bacterium]
MAKAKTRRQKAIIRRRIFLSACAVLLIGIIALLSFVIHSIVSPDKETDKNGPTKTESTVSEESVPEIKDSFATVLSTGDIMVHSTQLDGAYVKATGDYDFSAFFKECSPYFKNYDLSVANLEVTFGGTESGKFSGYPAFNTPDSLADAIKTSGLNFLLTANNHSYDTGLFGLRRTAQILKQKGIEFIGTRETESEPIYTVKEINGIKIGMANYTYESAPENAISGRKYLNGSIISAEANNLVSSFSYSDINAFYTDAENTIKSMKTEGAEFIVFYMHWGNEYKTNANSWQKTIAQNLSNLGVDIIIGSHPHVIQPIELIHSEDGQNQTICLYSTGNAVSNQRQEIMNPECPTGHTEDGLFFTYTLKKSTDGVTLTDIDIIPTWVNKYRGGGGYQYTIYPLEKEDDGSSKYGLDSAAVNKSKKSYQRTKEIIAEGLTACQQAIGCEITFQNEQATN